MQKSASKDSEELIIKVKVQPRSSRSGVVGSYGDVLKVKLRAAPVEGKANKELIGLLAKEYGVKKKDVEGILQIYPSIQTALLLRINHLRNIWQYQDISPAQKAP